MRRLALLLLSCALAVSGEAALALQTPDCPTGACPLAPAAPAAPIVVDARPIVRIENATSTGSAYGTGTLVDVDAAQGLVVTCAHLFRDGVGAIGVTFSGQIPLGAQLVKVDRRADLAALRIAAFDIEPVELADSYPQPGEPLVSCGYGSDGRLWCNQGRALGYVVTVGSHGRETLELSGTARQGDSGGPVFNRRGQLVAVLFGTNGHVVDATFCGRVREFLQGLSARFGRPVDAVPGEDEQVGQPHLEKVPPRIGRPLRRPADKAPQSENPLDKAADAIGDAATPWLSGKAAALLVSLGVPGGVAGIAGGAIVWLVMRRGKKRLHGELDRLRTRLDDQEAIHQQTAPAGAPTKKSSQVVERHHNRYVAYEAGSVDKAWAAAHARVGEKYPGAIPYLKIVEGVKDQLLSGIEEPLLS